MMEVRDKRVLIVGLARSGRAAALCFRRRGALVTVTDSRPPAAFDDVLPELLSQKIGVELGLHREPTFLRQHLIVVSPGVPWEMPLLKAARERDIPVVAEVEAASWFLKGPLIGVTGTNGKTTTTALIGKIFETSGFPTFVGGNIGVPLISAVDQVSPEALIVAELSSFQLEAVQHLRPHVAVLLNLTPNHLDRHPSFGAYVAAKAQIFRNQESNDYAVLNADDSTVVSLAPALASRKIFFSRRRALPEGVFVSRDQVIYRVGNLERTLLFTREVPLKGDFNLDNVLAAAASACALGASFEALRRAVRDFQAVEHRLEFVRDIRGVDFYNDSKATSVDATLKALSAFERGVHLILGGTDKGAPYTPLRTLLEGRVKEVLLIGAAAEKIAKDLDGAADIVRAGDLETAMRCAFSSGVPGDTILLAPACSSFDQFENFEQRGRLFKQIVERLAQEVDARARGPKPVIAVGPKESERQRPAAPQAREELNTVCATSLSATATEAEAPRTDSIPDIDVARANHDEKPLTPDIDSSPPLAKLKARTVRYPEFISVYEVGAEELSGSEGEPEGPAIKEWTLEDWPPAEQVEDEFLPFESRATSTLSAVATKQSRKGRSRVRERAVDGDREVEAAAAPKVQE